MIIRIHAYKIKLKTFTLLRLFKYYLEQEGDANQNWDVGEITEIASIN